MASDYSRALRHVRGVVQIVINWRSEFGCLKDHGKAAKWGFVENEKVLEGYNGGFDGLGILENAVDFQQKDHEHNLIRYPAIKCFPPTVDESSHLVLESIFGRSRRKQV